MLDQSAICLQVLGRCQQAEGVPPAQRLSWLRLLTSAMEDANRIADPEVRRNCFRSIGNTLGRMEAEYSALPHMQRVVA
ncbi:MAG TPA: hypothetical protein VFQ76_01800 [Longimicrobiaceae bacterium]|nr:hypothetical protein [Longimicrobiaceae bacterium]